MKKVKIDFDMLSDAIGTLPIDSVQSIFEICNKRVNLIKKNESFQLSGAQENAIDSFFKKELSEKVKSFITAPREINSNSYNYFSWLLLQDWSEIFTNEELDKNKRYCVYQHYKPYSKPIKSVKRIINKINFFGDYKIGEIMSNPFYIGKGIITRPYNFHRETAHKRALSNAMLNCSGNKNDIVNIVAKGLTEKQAYELESKLIYFFLPNYLPNGLLTNIDFPTVPPFKERLILHRRGGINDIKSNRILLGEECNKIFFT